MLPQSFNRCRRDVDYITRLFDDDRMLEGAAMGSDSTGTVTGSGAAGAPSDAVVGTGAHAGGGAAVAEGCTGLVPSPGEDPCAVIPTDGVAGVLRSHPVSWSRRSAKPAAAIVAPAARATQRPIGSPVWP